MAAILPLKTLALDTNLLLDLAEGADFAHDFKESFQARGYVLQLPPTAAGELHENYRHGETARKRELARIALVNVKSWEIVPLDLAAIEQSIAERFAQRALGAQLLPAEEWNDAVILGETSVKQIPLLVTSDRHLLDIDEDALRLRFDEADLLPVHVVHPKRLLRALQ